MGKGSGATQTIQKADPWAGLQPYLSDVFAQAQSQYHSSNPSYYPGQTVAQFTPDQTKAMDLTRQRALEGSADLDPAIKQLQDTSSGAFLNNNPYLDTTFDRAAGKVGDQYRKTVMPQLASLYSGAGRYGSGAMTTATGAASETLGDTISGLANDIYGGNYQQERNRQMQAAGLLPQLAGAQATLDYGDINALMGVGGMQQGMDQQNINADVARYDFNQNLPAMKLAQYNQLLQGGLGFGGTTTQQEKLGGGGFNTTGGIGGALAGYQLAGMLGGAGAAAGGGAAAGAASGAALGPWGALAGLVLGGLM